MGQNHLVPNKTITETRLFWVISAPMLILGIIMIVVLLLTPT